MKNASTEVLDKSVKLVRFLFRIPVCCRDEKNTNIILPELYKLHTRVISSSIKQLEIIIMPGEFYL